MNGLSCGMMKVVEEQQYKDHDDVLNGAADQKVDQHGSLVRPNAKGFGFVRDVQDVDFWIDAVVRTVPVSVPGYSTKSRHVVYVSQSFCSAIRALSCSLAAL